MYLLRISVIIPTLNSEEYLQECLESIVAQEFPRKNIEILIIDGGSKDNTLKIAKRYPTKIYRNPLKTGETGKAIGLRHAKYELLAFIDSDNILPSRDWFKRMVEPLRDSGVIGSEPIEYTYRRSDGFITRYSALLGMNDPICLFLGNYDRYSYLTGTWTGLSLYSKDKGNWIDVSLSGRNIPTIGANGTIFRKSVFSGRRITDDYLFDVDVIANLAYTEPIIFAKVKIGIIHVFCGSDVLTFIRKQYRRVRDYYYYKKFRTYPWVSLNIYRFIFFIISCITIVPLIFQMIIGYIKKPDIAWFFHPFACMITLCIYSYGLIFHIFVKSPYDGYSVKRV